MADRKTIVLAWVELTGAEKVHGETEWRDGILRTKVRTGVPVGRAAVWLSSGTSADATKARAHMKSSGAPSHAVWGGVFTYPTTERDPQGRARRDALAAYAKKGRRNPTRKNTRRRVYIDFDTASTPGGLYYAQEIIRRHNGKVKALHGGLSDWLRGSFAGNADATAAESAGKAKGFRTRKGLKEYWLHRSGADPRRRNPHGEPHETKWREEYRLGKTGKRKVIFETTLLRYANGNILAKVWRSDKRSFVWLKPDGGVEKQPYLHSYDHVYFPSTGAARAAANAYIDKLGTPTRTNPRRKRNGGATWPYNGPLDADHRFFLVYGPRDASAWLRARKSWYISATVNKARTEVELSAMKEWGGPRETATFKLPQMGSVFNTNPQHKSNPFSTVEYRMGRRGVNVYIDGVLATTDAAISYEEAESIAYDMLVKMGFGSREAGKMVKAATRKHVAASNARRKRNPVSSPGVSPALAAQLRDMGAYVNWHPETAKIVKLIRLMDRTKSRKMLTRAYQKANDIVRKHPGALPADVVNDIGFTYVAAWERVTGKPYGHDFKQGYGAGGKPVRRSHRRRNPNSEGDLTIKKGDRVRHPTMGDGTFDHKHYGGGHWTASVEYDKAPHGYAHYGRTWGCPLSKLTKIRRNAGGGHR